MEKKRKMCIWFDIIYIYTDSIHGDYIILRIGVYCTVIEATRLEALHVLVIMLSVFSI